jgi:hypothetical protein
MLSLLVLMMMLAWLDAIVYTAIVVFSTNVASMLMECKAALCTVNPDHVILAEYTNTATS